MFAQSARADASDNVSRKRRYELRPRKPMRPDEFQAPSGNIGCQYVPAGGTETYRTPDGGPQLICDRIEPAYVRFTLSARGAATLIEHVGDASCCGGDVMPARRPLDRRAVQLAT